MAKLATCPSCTTQLALPEFATLSDRARCPRCGQQFLLMESVQFSIPDAEMLPAEPEHEVSMPGTITPDAYVEAPTNEETYSDPYAYPKHSSSYEVPSEEVPESELTEHAEVAEPADLTEAAPLSSSATLSDWEARLKRAISGERDIETEAIERLSTKPYSPPEYFAIEPTESEETSKHVDVPTGDDFSISEDDFRPPVESSEPKVEEWTARDEYELESRPAAEARASFESMDDLDDEMQDEEMPSDHTETFAPEFAVNENAASAPRRKKKRSVLRTMMSASLGVVGIPLGLYVLLWLRGPAGDVANIAQYLPAIMLPPSFSQGVNDRAEAILVQQEPVPATEDAADSTLAGETDEELSATELAKADIAEESPEVLKDPEVAPASAQTPASTAVLPYRGPKFELVDHVLFNELLAAAEDAAPQLAEGDLNSKESIAKKGQAYMVLAQLADKGSYFSQPGLDIDQSAQAARAQQLFRTTFRKDSVKRDLPQIALRWWQYAKRPSPGMLMIGKVDRLETTDSGTIAYVSLGIDGVAPAIPVLLRSSEIKVDDLIGVVGSISTDPLAQSPEIKTSPGPMLVSYYAFPLAPFADADLPPTTETTPDQATP